MATKIVTKNSSTASAVPTASDLVQGELAVNVADKRLFTEDNGGSIVELGTNPSTIDINAGSIDGTAIGATSASTGAFTTLTATGAFTSVGIDDNATSTAITIDSSENVGIGTSVLTSNSIVRELAVKSTATNGVSRYTLTTTDNGLGASISLSSYLDENALIFGLQTSYDEDGTASPTERMRIDSSGNVGIGTSSPNSYPVASNLVVDAGTNGGITVKSGTSNYGGVYFADGTTGNEQYRGFIQYNHNYVGSTDALLLGTAGTERMRIDSSGNLLVGQTAQNYNGVGASIGSDGLIRAACTNQQATAFNRKGNDGVISVFYKDGVNVGSISTNANSLPSDRNFKRNIQNLTLGLDFVESLNPVTYNFKIDDEGQAVMTGLIAQEVEEALTAAGVEKNSMTLLQHKPTEDVSESDYQMDYLKFVPILINSIKEQQTLIESLTARIAALEE